MRQAIGKECFTMAQKIYCPKCGKDIHRTVSTASAGMSGLSCSSCKIHFDIKIDRDGSYTVVKIR